MPTISLDRRFAEWGGDELYDLELLDRWGLNDRLLSWQQILARRRVVILAEAGSGKSTELREQARLRAAAGQFAFYASVEDVGQDGLDGALAASDRERLSRWRQSTERAWLFLDSVDEAKLHNIRLDKAIRRVADGITDCERRAHLVFSCRLTDWEAKDDTDRLRSGLPIPGDPSTPPPPTSDDFLVSALRQERPREVQPTAEEPLIAVMVSLDTDRVATFARSAGIADVDAFLRRIDDANLWRFARRPLDLGWLVEFWRAHDRLGTLAEMLESSLERRSRETNPGRSQTDTLDSTRALRAVERIGGALVFTRKQRSQFRIPRSLYSKKIAVLTSLQYWPTGPRRTARAS